MRSKGSPLRRAQRWMRTWPHALSWTLCALMLTACASGTPQRVGPKPPSPPPQAPAAELRMHCPEHLPELQEGASVADMLRAWIKAARQHHSCRKGKQSLSEALSTYEQAVEANYCADMRAAGLDSERCAQP